MHPVILNCTILVKCKK